VGGRVFGIRAAPNLGLTNRSRYLATRWTPSKRLQANEASKPAFNICILTLSGFLSPQGSSYYSFHGNSSATRLRSLSQEEVLPSAAANGAATWAGLLQGKIRRAVMLYASSVDGSVANAGWDTLQAGWPGGHSGEKPQLGSSTATSSHAMKCLRAPAV
jgi:hypothetical protein